MLKIDDFKTAVKPSNRTSKLTKFIGDIQVLRGDGYTLAQIQEYLKGNGVTISIPGLSAYLKRKEGKPPNEGLTKAVDAKRGQQVGRSPTATSNSGGFNYPGTVSEDELI